MRFKIGSTYTLGYGIGKVKIESPTAKGKTFKAVRQSDGKSIHFGDSDMPTRQDNPKAKKAYCDRAANLAPKGFNPNTFSLIYWDCIPSTGSANNMLQSDDVNQESEQKVEKVLLQTNVSKSMITDKGDKFIIKGIPITVNDAVMNGVHYPADENEAGMNSMIDKPLTIGHPKDDTGNFVTGREGQGLQNHFSGGFITNVYEVNNIWYADADVKKDVLKAQSEELYNNLESKKSMPVSTGLLFSQNDISGVNAKGDSFKKVAKGQSYDHLAALLNEAPAGGKDTVATFNSENIAIVNVNEHIPQESAINKIVECVLHMLKRKVYNGSDINVNEQNKVEIMTREESLELLGLNAEAEISDAALNSLVANMAKKGMDKTKVDDEDEDDEEKMKAKKNGKAYKQNSSDNAELLARIDKLESALNAKQDEQLEKDAKTLGLSVNTLKLMPEDERKTLIANQAKTGVNFAANGEKPLEAVNGIQLKAHSF